MFRTFFGKNQPEIDIQPRWRVPEVNQSGSAGQVTPRAERLILRILRPLTRLLYGPRLEGVEHLPAAGPYLLVANHSACIALAELGSLMALWLGAFGTSRPLAGFAHPLGLRLFPASAVLAGVGAIPSTFEAGRAALAAGVPVLIFPGGDHEAMRPLWQAARVDFGGRAGFIRLARAAGVPVVPLGIRGSHVTAPVLWRSRHLLPWGLVLPRAVGLKRWPLTLLGALGAAALCLALPGPLWGPAAAWLWLASPLTLLPLLPSRLRFRIGPALSPATVAEGTDAEAARRVEAAVQALVLED